MQGRKQKRTVKNLPVNSARTHFVALIGIDLVGKTTQLSRLQAHYSNRGYRVATVALTEKPTYENVLMLAKQRDPTPTDFPFGLEPNYFAFALYSDFFNHYCNNIIPYFQTDLDLLISDRYCVCYQAYAYAVGASCKFAHKFLDGIIPEPDQLICLDLDVESALRRAKLRKNGRYFDETRKMLNHLSCYYTAFCHDHPEVIVLNASRTIEEVTTNIIEVIDRSLL